MPLPKGQNFNHPKKGSSIKVSPIRDKKAIKRIKKILEDNPRNYCLFVFGINTALRANEILSIKVQDVADKQPGDDFEIKQSKTHKHKRVTLNKPAVMAIDKLLKSTSFADNDYLFKGQRGVLTVPTLSTLVKRWCADVGLKGNYGSHSLRKTWGYWQRVERNTPIPLLMHAFGHSTQRQTMQYLGIQEQEIRDIYLMEL